MFVIATSGRCGTLAICEGLDRFSDHSVEHEPDPPLREAWLAHTGEDPWTEELRAWTRRLAAAPDRSGLSWRAPNLLPIVRRARPDARVLVIVREPADYVLSAHAKRVLSKTGAYERFRLMPDDAADAPLAERIALHWCTVNTYLVDFAEQDPRSRVATLGDLGETLPDWCEFLGVTLTDPAALDTFLSARPNAATSREPPPGFDAARIAAVCGGVWERARRLSATAAPPAARATSRTTTRR